METGQTVAAATIRAGDGDTVPMGTEFCLSALSLSSSPPALSLSTHMVGGSSMGLMCKLHLGQQADPP